MKKGFTLIELLAVIVILAVIALIVTPVITGIITMTKKSADLRSAEGYVESVKNRLLSNILENQKLEDGLYTVEQLKSKNVEFSGATPSGDVAILNGTVVSADLVFNGNKVNVNSFGVASTDSKVYGMRWDGDSTFTRLNDAEGLNTCVGTDTEVCISDFDSAEIYNEIHDVVVDGNAFVYIPKFYIKKVVNGNTWEWYVSKMKKDDTYYLPACFYDVATSRELPYVLIGKYAGSLDSTGTKLESKTGVMLLNERSIEDFRTLARANNNGDSTGYQIYDIHALDIIQTLFFIEFKDLDASKYMRSYTSGHSTSIINGESDSVKAKSGSVSSNTDGNHSMRYRGIENIYGNIWQFCDGVTFDNDTSSIYVNKNAATYASNVITGDYKKLGYAKLREEGSIKVMGYDSNYPFAQFPISIDNVSSKYSDSYYQNNLSGTVILMVGGNMGDYTCAGLADFDTYVYSDYYDVIAGSRLMKKAI